MGSGLLETIQHPRLQYLDTSGLLCLQSTRVDRNPVSRTHISCLPKVFLRSTTGDGTDGRMIEVLQTLNVPSLTEPSRMCAPGRYARLQQDPCSEMGLRTVESRPPAQLPIASPTPLRCDLHRYKGVLSHCPSPDSGDLASPLTSAETTAPGRKPDHTELDIRPLSPVTLMALTEPYLLDWCSDIDSIITDMPTQEELDNIKLFFGAR
ncbi:hypothetical protein DFP72DRAFT_519825 [Ephemerocybe angulata]|uniref:Uncharacterized protein n=1 Tax=Ephemerocybe angulata TaxID=980116 RepID=A0A8H6IF11_9AGAR|nr:hypothetical protein DFP72DRAFT_519825 [Tulosesus angulatus]